eukprot:4131045-Pyramimonas_sp.AAC.1
MSTFCLAQRKCGGMFKSTTGSRARAVMAMSYLGGRSRRAVQRRAGTPRARARERRESRESVERSSGRGTGRGERASEGGPAGWGVACAEPRRPPPTWAPGGPAGHVPAPLAPSQSQTTVAPVPRGSRFEPAPTWSAARLQTAPRSASGS